MVTKRPTCNADLPQDRPDDGMNAPRRLGLIGLPFVAVVGVSYISGRPPVLPELSTETFPPARPVNRPPCPVGSAFAFSRTQAHAGIVRSHLKQKLQGLSNIHSGRLRSAVSLLQSIAMAGVQNWCKRRCNSHQAKRRHYTTRILPSSPDACRCPADCDLLQVILNSPSIRAGRFRSSRGSVNFFKSSVRHSIWKAVEMANCGSYALALR